MKQKKQHDGTSRQLRRADHTTSGASPVSKDNVLAFPNASKKRTVGVINQSDFDRFYMYSKKLKKAEERWQKMRDYILNGIMLNWPIEPGAHDARLVRYHVRKRIRERLLVR